MLKPVMVLARRTLADPRGAARALLGDSALGGRGLELAVLVVALGVLVAALIGGSQPEGADALLTGLLRNPLLFAVIQFMLLFLSALAIFAIGRMFGGSGDFEGALLISVWLQFMSVLVQLGLLPLSLLLPGAAALLTTFFYLYFVWLMVVFIAELHRFQSLFKVFGGVLASSFALAVMVGILLAFIGVSVE